MSEERIIVINLRRVYDGRKAQRAARAIRKLREIVARRTHAEVVKVDESVNHAIWGRSIEKPPKRIKVRIIIEEKREVKTKKGETKSLPKVVKVALHSEEKPKAEAETTKK